jgi:hypothetical protein
MKKALLTGIAALFLATGTAHAQSRTDGGDSNVPAGTRYRGPTTPNDPLYRVPSSPPVDYRPNYDPHAYKQWDQPKPQPEGTLPAKWIPRWRWCSIQKIEFEEGTGNPRRADSTEVDLHDVLQLQKFVSFLRKCEKFKKCVEERDGYTKPTGEKPKHCYLPKDWK